MKRLEHGEPYTDVAIESLVHQIYSRVEIRKFTISECNAFYREHYIHYIFEPV